VVCLHPTITSERELPWSHPWHHPGKSFRTTASNSWGTWNHDFLLILNLRGCLWTTAYLPHMHMCLCIRQARLTGLSIDFAPARGGELPKSMLKPVSCWVTQLLEAGDVNILLPQVVEGYSKMATSVEGLRVVKECGDWSRRQSRVLLVQGAGAGPAVRRVSSRVELAIKKALVFRKPIPAPRWDERSTSIPEKLQSVLGKGTQFTVHIQ
jgi:hypothetical protein